jgi:hypothetical protein
MSTSTKRRAGRPSRALCLAALVGSLAGLPACAQTPAWQRAWTVHAFDCATCSAEDRAWLKARVGQQVVMARDRFLNPLYEDCPAGADYSDLLSRSPAEAAKLLGTGKLPVLQSARPLAGEVRCQQPSGPPNVVARIVIDGQRAFLLHESGAVLRLR